MAKPNYQYEKRAKELAKKKKKEEKLRRKQENAQRGTTGSDDAAGDFEPAPEGGAPAPADQAPPE